MPRAGFLCPPKEGTRAHIDTCSALSDVGSGLPESDGIQRSFRLTAVLFGRCFALAVA